MKKLILVTQNLAHLAKVHRCCRAPKQSSPSKCTWTLRYWLLMGKETHLTLTKSDTFPYGPRCSLAQKRVEFTTSMSPSICSYFFFSFFFFKALLPCYYFHYLYITWEHSSVENIRCLLCFLLLQCLRHDRCSINC